MGDLAAIILCGGASSRMGSPKAWLEIDGETLLGRTARVLSPLCSPVIVVGAEGQSLPPLPAEVIVVRDRVPAAGPLAGLAAGLAVADGRDSRAAFVCGTDAPLLHPAFARRLAELRLAHAAAVPRVDGRVHPLAAVYAVEARAEVDSSLLRGDLRLTSLVERLAARYVDAAELLLDPLLASADPALDSLRNVNTREDLRAALARR